MRKLMMVAGYVKKAALYCLSTGQTVFQIIQNFMMLHVFNSIASFWIFVLLVTTATMAAFAFFGNFQAFTDNSALCAFTAIMVCFTCLVALGPFLIDDIGMPKLFVCLTIQATSLVFTYAGIYRGYGLESTQDVSWDIALYFSIVTWTTLGYGDYQPEKGIELIAASEAVFGYLYLGMMVALISNLFDRNNTN